MDLGPLRALVLDLNVSAHGLDVTVTPLGGSPIETRGIWLTPTTEDVPSATHAQRRDPRRVMALTRESITGLPIGSVIVAPERSGGIERTWRVDGLDRIEADHLRVIVVEDDPDS